MKLYSHKCIKPGCDNSYEDEDVDAYYCDSCKEANKVLAKQIEARVGKSTEQDRPKSELQMYDELCKMRGSKFISIKDMGISL